VSQAAAAILGAQRETVEEVIAPPDLWSRRQDTGRSAAEIFAASGVPLVKAGSSRIDGWLNVKEYLRCDMCEPEMMFFSTCTPLLRCLPLLRHDTVRPGDVATQPHDLTHSPDALRYWCSRRQLKPKSLSPHTPSPFGPRPRTSDTMEGYLLGGFEQ
jgi:phage terminase large subunit